MSEYLTESFKSRPNRIERSVVDLKRRWWQSDCGGHVLWETCYWMRERDKERKRDRERKEERERKKDKERKKERKEGRKIEKEKEIKKERERNDWERKSVCERGMGVCVEHFSVKDNVGVPIWKRERKVKEREWGKWSLCMGDNIRDRERKIWISRCVTRERERVRMWLVRGKHMCVIKRERERERGRRVWDAGLAREAGVCQTYHGALQAFPSFRPRCTDQQEPGHLHWKTY